MHTVPVTDWDEEAPTRRLTEEEQLENRFVHDRATCPYLPIESILIEHEKEYAGSVCDEVA